MKRRKAKPSSPQDTVATPTPAPVIRARNFRMADWRASPELVKYAQQRFAEPQFQLLLAVMDNEHVRNLTHTLPVPAQSDSKQLGKIEGWDLFRNTLASAEDYHAQPKPLEPTYAAENNL